MPRPIIYATVLFCGLLAAPAVSAPSAMSEAERAAAKEIGNSRSVMAVHFEREAVVQWTIGMRPDKSPRRFGYAHYACDELRSRGLSGPDTIVRVVNGPAVSIGRKTFRQASLGAVQCATHEEMFP